MITGFEIQQNLIRAIKQSSLSRNEIAQRLKVSRKTIEKYVEGKALPNLKTFRNLCIILNVNTNEILCLKKNDGNN